MLRCRQLSRKPLAPSCSCLSSRARFAQQATWRALGTQRPLLAPCRQPRLAVPPRIQQQSLVFRRTIFTDPRDPFNTRRAPGPAPWIKPALYAAGGMALAVVAWPVLRFVALGGLGYLAYRTIRLWMIARSINSMMQGRSTGNREEFNFRDTQASPVGPLSHMFRMFEGSGVFDMFASGRSKKSASAMQKVAEDSLRCAFENDERLRGLVDMPDARNMAVGDAMEYQSTSVNGNESMEAIYPVFFGNQASTLFVQAAGSVKKDGGLGVDWVRALARVQSGEVVEVKLDVVEGGKDYAHTQSERPNRRLGSVYSMVMRLSEGKVQASTSSCSWMSSETGQKAHCT
ncbi:hypothetical protein GQ54DRAFT_56165 [Martensiomyces pterosporus]|nr:hypothetical protein GQ54DRAFT_56165 [Martensiomyces pterosporus]